jgi:hypothetical protein
MSSHLPRPAGAIRTLAPFAALGTVALATACADPSSPSDRRDASVPVGMYVLQTVPFHPEVTVLAETLFVETPTTYRVSGLYDFRRDGQRYTRSAVRDVISAPDGRPMLPGTSVAGPIGVRGDTLVVYDPGYSEPDLFEAGRYVAAAPPPPAGPVASFVVTTADTMVRHGESIDLAPLVVRGLDATGRWIADPSFTVVAPAGWAASAGVLAAPQRDEIGVARIAAGGAATEIRVHAVPDLRASRWSLAWSCAEPSVANAPQLGDSATYAMTVDSAGYVPTAGPPYPAYPFMNQGYYSKPWGQAALYARGTRTVWSGGVATTSEWQRNFNVVSQRADAIWILPPYPERDHSGPPAPGVRFERTTDAARTYVAAPGAVTIDDFQFCRKLSYLHTSAVRLAELPPG